MTKDGKSWLWTVPAAAGLALVMVALALWSPGPSNPGAPPVHAQETGEPTATTTPPECILDIEKDDNVSTAPEGGQIVYTITVSNDADSGACNDLTVSDEVPADTDCVSASVEENDADLDFDQDAIDESCEDNDVEWFTDDSFADGEEVVLELVIELDSSIEEGDHVSNTACANSDGPGTVLEACDTVRTTIGAPATATPTAAPTATARPTVIAPTAAPVIPTAVVQPLIGPATGTGGESGSGGSGPLALALGLTGGLLLLASGAAFVRRPR